MYRGRLNVLTEIAWSKGTIIILARLGILQVDPNGMLCDCGRKGCLQMFIAEGAFIQRAKIFDGSVESIEDIFKFWNKKTAWTIDIIDQAKTKTYIKMGLNNLACLYNPDVIVIGGNIIDKY